VLLINKGLAEVIMHKLMIDQLNTANRLTSK